MPEELLFCCVELSPFIKITIKLMFSPASQIAENASADGYKEYGSQS